MLPECILFVCLPLSRGFYFMSVPQEKVAEVMRGHWLVGSKDKDDYRSKVEGSQ